MQLLQHSLNGAGDRQAEVGSVLQQGHAFIENVEEDRGSAQDASGLDYLNVEDVSDAHENKNEDFPEDP